jgi:dolichyl-phosphate beta-glucosyltransferase
MKESIDLSIIIPAYHEADRIGQSLEKLATFLRTRNYGEVEVLVIAQGDDTGPAAAKAGSHFRHFRVVDLKHRPGKGGAVRAGIFEAKGRYKLFMDADLATPLTHLDDVKAVMDRGSEVGICVRNLGVTHKGLRKFISGFGNMLVQVLLLPGIKDSQCGFKVFESKAADEIFSRQTLMSWGFDMEVLALARKFGYKIEIIPTDDWKDPKKVGLVGDSNLKVAIQTFLDLLKIRLNLTFGKYRDKRFKYVAPKS